MTAPPTSDVTPPPTPPDAGHADTASPFGGRSGAGRAGGAARGGRFHVTVQSAWRRPAGPVDGATAGSIRATCRPTRQRPRPTGCTAAASGVTVAAPPATTRT